MTRPHADTRLALLKASGAKLVVLVQDDDSGVDRNASVQVKLKKGDVIRVQVRMRFIDTPGEAALMVW